MSEKNKTFLCMILLKSCMLTELLVRKNEYIMSVIEKKSKFRVIDLDIQVILELFTPQSYWLEWEISMPITI